MGALFDFSNAQPPKLWPLGKSYDDHEIDRQLKELFLNIFSEKLSVLVFDTNVLGAAHLGSFPSVQRAVNADGLVLLKKPDEDPATRYLYRAWMSANGQGRGLHFLRTYLQIQFPNQPRVDQLWHPVDETYPSKLTKTNPKFSWWLYQVGEPGLKVGQKWGVGRFAQGNLVERKASRKPSMEGLFLTSRIEIGIDRSVNARDADSLLNIIQSVIPARLIVDFKSLFQFRSARIESADYFLMARRPLESLVVSSEQDALFRLWNTRSVTLPAPFVTEYHGNPEYFRVSSNGLKRKPTFKLLRSAPPRLSPSLYVTAPIPVRLLPDCTL